MELNWKEALLSDLSRHMDSLRSESHLNKDAVEAMALVYTEGWKDCLRWLVKQGVVGNG